MLHVCVVVVGGCCIYCCVCCDCLLSFRIIQKENRVFLIFVDVFFIGFVQFLNGTTSLLKVGFRERERARA